MEESPDVLRFYRDWIADAPDELMTIVVHRKAPRAPFVPPSSMGELVVERRLLLRGLPSRTGRGRAAAQAFGSPVLDLCQPKPFLAHPAMFDPSFPHGWWYYFRSCDVAELTDQVIDITVDHSLRIESPLTTFPIWQMGGAVARVGEDETAFNGRGAGTHSTSPPSPRRPTASTRSGNGSGTSGRPSSPTTRAST